MKKPKYRDSVLHEVVAGSPALAESTKDRYLRDLNVWIDYAGNDPKNWTYRTAQAFYNYLLHDKKLMPQSASRTFASVTYASKWWAHQENNPLLHFGLVQTHPNAKGDPRHPLTPEQALALLRTCNTPEPIDLRDRALIVLGLETGMRRMSLQSVMFEHTFLDELACARAKEPYPTARVFMKGSRQDRVTVPISDIAILAMQPWFAWLTGRKIKRGPIFIGISRRVAAGGHMAFVASDKAISATAIKKVLTTRAERAGVAHVHPHLLRHSFVTWRAQERYMPHEIAAMTGHTMKGASLQGLGDYYDRSAMGAKIRNSTPAWLAEYIRSISQ